MRFGVMLVGAHEVFDGIVLEEDGGDGVGGLAQDGAEADHFLRGKRV